jgi:hypothetical protein
MVAGILLRRKVGELFCGLHLRLPGLSGGTASTVRALFVQCADAA